MAKTVGIRELKQRTSAIVARVRRRNEAMDVTHRGTVVARIVPVPRPAARGPAVDALWAELDGLTREIGERWPKGVSAEEAISRERRG